MLWLEADNITFITPHFSSAEAHLNDRLHTAANCSFTFDFLWMNTGRPYGFVSVLGVDLFESFF